MATFQGLGFLPNGSDPSKGLGVSPNGQVVCGSSRNQYNAIEAFRWPVNNLMDGLGDLHPDPPFESCAHAVSNTGGQNNGPVVVGRGLVGVPTNPRIQGFHYDTDNGTLTELPFFGGFFSGVDDDCVARDVDNAGTTIAGKSSQVGGKRNAVYWEFDATSNEWDVIDLEDLNQGCGSMAYAISGDAQVIVGKSDSVSPVGKTDEAVMWTLQNNQYRVETLHRSTGRRYKPAKALDVSQTLVNTERLIVGQCFSRRHRLHSAFLFWTNAPRIVLLRSQTNRVITSKALGVGSDQNNSPVIVGYFDENTGQGDEAFVWFWTSPDPTNPQLPAKRMLALKHVLSQLGENGANGWQLNRAYSVSEDGTAIAGYGQNANGQTEAFLATVP